MNKIISFYRKMLELELTQHQKIHLHHSKVKKRVSISKIEELMR